MKMHLVFTKKGFLSFVRAIRQIDVIPRVHLSVIFRLRNELFTRKIKYTSTCYLFIFQSTPRQ